MAACGMWAYRASEGSWTTVNAPDGADALEAPSPIAARAREDHAHGAPPVHLGDRVEQDVNRRPGKHHALGLPQLEVAVDPDKMGVRRAIQACPGMTTSMAAASFTGSAHPRPITWASRGRGWDPRWMATRRGASKPAGSMESPRATRVPTRGEVRFPQMGRVRPSYSTLNVKPPSPERWQHRSTTDR